MLIERKVEIEAPPAKIWDFLANFDNWTELTRSVSLVSTVKNSFKPREGAAPGAGMKLQVTGKGFAQEWTASAWEPGKLMAFGAEEKSWYCAYRMDLALLIAPRTSLATEVTAQWRLEPAGRWTALFLSLPGGEARADRQLAMILERLKSALER